MKPARTIQLVGELLDLPLVDCEGEYCGVVDDLEFTGGPGKRLKLEALLVGPGAYAGRLPNWAMWLVRRIAGDRITRVPVSQIAAIRSVVKLKSAASKLGLDKADQRAAKWLPHGEAL